MKKITFIFVVLCMDFANAQSFSPVWEGSYLPEQEAGCYVSFLDMWNETICVGRSCGDESKILFGNILSEDWAECSIPDSLGEVYSGAVMDGDFYIYTESGWVVRVSESCETESVVKTDGWAKIAPGNDTLYIFGSGIYLGDTLSTSLVHYFVPATNTTYPFLTPEAESILGLTIFQEELFCVGLDDGFHKVFKLNDSIWNVVYVFPENEHFVSWADGGDRIYVSSTSFSPPVEYGILSEWKDGDMDSLFASDGNILAIEATDCFVFCVGNFTNFGNCDAENLAMFDRATKEIIQTDRGLDGNGYVVSSGDDFVYVGGAFMYGADIYSPGIISLPACAEDLSVAENMEEIKIFPNPAESLIRIQNGAGKEVRVFSLSREIFLLQNEVEKDKILYLENILSGTYYLLIEGKIFSFIKI